MNNHRKPRRTESIVFKFDKFSLSDLKKVRRAHETYALKMSAYKLRCDEVDAQNQSIELANRGAEQSRKLWEETTYYPLLLIENQLEQKVKTYRMGFLSGMTTNHITFEGYKYPLEISTLISQLQNTRANTLRAHETEPLFLHASKVYMPPPPQKIANLTISGTTLRVFVDLRPAGIEQLEKLITAQEEKHQELKARATSNENETRRQAQKFRRDLHKQLSNLAGCPYCGGLLSDSNAHLDHIYPVAKGGLSTLKNLVFVCVRCNIAKTDSVLRKFIQQAGHNEQQVYDRLDILQKEF
ncbi:MAG: HNH endonuclease signature motif containing protein [Gallionella sp.]